MERHKCKLCSRSFNGGRALGGHMRTHLVTLPIPPETPQQTQQLTGSTSSVSCSEQEEERGSTEEKVLVYGLRENPKKSFRSVDPEFLDGSLFFQDRESESEPTRNPSRRRSKRPRKIGVVGQTENQELKEPSSAESLSELEPVSSVSDTSDVALCLMMLSKDVWWSPYESEDVKLSQTHCKYKCETCKKMFRSSQALGSHRTSHKKIKISCEDESKQPRNVDQKVCPFCGKVFRSGQALGGHKRTHILASSTTVSSSVKLSLVEDKDYANFGESLIDLNLPAPMEDEVLDVSAVSDA